MFSGAGPNLLPLIVIGNASVPKLPRVKGITGDLLGSILIRVLKQSRIRARGWLKSGGRILYMATICHPSGLRELQQV
jgi:hypothetical protein